PSAAEEDDSLALAVEPNFPSAEEDDSLAPAVEPTSTSNDNPVPPTPSAAEEDDSLASAVEPNFPSAESLAPSRPSSPASPYTQVRFEKTVSHSPQHTHSRRESSLGTEQYPIDLTASGGSSHTLPRKRKQSAMSLSRSKRMKDDDEHPSFQIEYLEVLPFEDSASFSLSWNRRKGKWVVQGSKTLMDVDTLLGGKYEFLCIKGRRLGWDETKLYFNEDERQWEGLDSLKEWKIKVDSASVEMAIAIAEPPSNPSTTEE
ncbi:hypothetical protein AK830_g12601, partial [Neonectria ditissima]